MSESSRWARFRSRSLVPTGCGLLVLALRRRSLAAVPLLAVLSALQACGGSEGTTETPPPPDTQVARVEVTAAAASVPESQSVQLSARALTASGAVLAGRSFTWQSSNTSIATVDANGVVQGLVEGSANVTATESSGKSGTLAVAVTPAPVARVEVSAAAASVMENQSVQLSARAVTAAGIVLAGRPFTWQSSNTAVATVDANGVVRGVVQGSATITATESSGKSGTLAVAVTPSPVATVSVSAPEARVKSGKQLQLAVTLTDAAGRVLTGREVTWSVSNPAVATVNANGLLLARSPGIFTVSAASGGKSGLVALMVFQLAPARITVAPEMTALAVGETVRLRAAAVDAEGDTIPTPPLILSETRRAGAAVLAATGEAGVYRGAALGHATVRTELDGISSNTAVVAVLGTGELLATAFPNGSPMFRARAGDRVTVPVILDMSRVATPGDLGAVELEIGYAGTALELKSATPGIAGTISEGKTPGRYRLSFASTTPTGSARLTVVTLVFEVSATAQVGATVPFTLTFPSAPASTGFAAYPQPVVLNGALLIIPN